MSSCIVRDIYGFEKDSSLESYWYLAGVATGKLQQRLSNINAIFAGTQYFGGNDQQDLKNGIREFCLVTPTLPANRLCLDKSRWIMTKNYDIQSVYHAVNYMDTRKWPIATKYCICTTAKVCGDLMPLLLTWINFNPSMDKQSHDQDMCD